MSKADLARKYRKEYDEKFKKEFPDGIPTLKLARILYKENNLIFKDVDDARSTLKYIEGKSGRKKKHWVTKTEFVKDEARSKNPYSLPESDEADFIPFKLKGHKRIGILSDIHIPYHSVHAVTKAIEFCKKEKIDALLLNGDILDAYQLSRFSRDPRKRNFAQELNMFKQLFETFEKQLKCKIYFKLGNHSVRYQHFLFQKAGELLGVEEFEFENIIKARAKGIEIIGDKTIIRINELNVIHGHEMGQSLFNPVGAARGLFLKGNASALQGHYHRSSEFSDTNMNGKVITTWSTGCLSSLHPEFLPINKWNWGFAVVDADANGRNYFVRNLRIIKDNVY
jgi:predicted phosphodiesterase